jgi:hypothetical protein
LNTLSSLKVGIHWLARQKNIIGSSLVRMNDALAEQRKNVLDNENQGFKYSRMNLQKNRLKINNRKRSRANLT